MKEASVRDLRYDFKKIERLLQQGQEIRITKRRKVIGSIVPERAAMQPAMPDFKARLQEIYGDRILPITGAGIVADGRNRDPVPAWKKGSEWQRRPGQGTSQKARVRSTRTAAS